MRWRGFERYGAFAAATALFVAAAPAYGKSWGAPQAAGDGTGIGAVGDSTGVAVAMDGPGNALIGYADGHTVQVRTRAPDGTLGPAQTLAQASPQVWLHDVDVVADEDGNALVAWIAEPGQGSLEVVAATRTPGGQFGPPQTVATDVHARDRFSLAIAAGGWAAIIWDHDRQPEYIEASIRPPGLPFGAPEKISPDESTIDAPRIAIDAQGTATAVWDNYNWGLAETATRPAQGPWGATEPLGPARMASSWPSIGVDDQGNALAAFMTDRSPEDTSTVMRARYRPAGGALGPAEQLSQPPERTAGTVGSLAPAPIGFDAAGTATVLWRAGPSGQLFASTRPRDGNFDAGTPVSSDTTTEDARLAVSAGGAAFAIWWPPLQSSLADVPRPLLVSARPPGAGFEPPQQLSSGAVAFDVAADAAGNGLAAWVVRYGGACGQVMVAAYTDSPIPAAPGPPPKPACAGGPGPEPEPDPGPGTTDTTPPTIKVTGAKRQRPLGRRRVTIALRCSEDCTATANATVKLRGRGARQAAGRAKIAFKPATKRLSAGKRSTIVLKLSARDARNLARALKSKRQSAAVVVTAADAARNRAHARRTVVLTR